MSNQIFFFDVPMSDLAKTLGEAYFWYETALCSLPPYLETPSS